jgi:hypothetical protein
MFGFRFPTWGSVFSARLPARPLPATGAQQASKSSVGTHLQQIACPGARLTISLGSRSINGLIQMGTASSHGNQ